jgi:hypothetical protein
MTDTLDRLLDPVSRCLSPEVARALVNLRADPSIQSRLDELADKNTENRLTPEEREQYELYLSAISIITVLQSKARMILKATTTDGHSDSSPGA